MDGSRCTEIGTALTASREPLDRLAELLGRLSLDSGAPAATAAPIPIKTKIKIKQRPLATSWQWTYEETDDFSQKTTNIQELITDLRDWHDLTCTDRDSFSSLIERLARCRSGDRVRLSIERDGRKVVIKDCSPETSPDISIQCS